jgi:hypothetical protein
MSSAEMRAFLEEGTRTGKLATVRADGRPHIVPVWFVLDGDDVVFTTWHRSVKAGNMRRTGRAALLVDLEEPPYGYVLVDGSVTFGEDPDELLAFATKIGGRYMGQDRGEEFGRRNGVKGEWLVRLRMGRVVTAANVSD